MKALELDAIPPLPYVAHEIMLTMNTDGDGIDRISQAMSREPGLTARLVALANAAFVARHRPVYSTRDAVLRLGLDRVRVVAASVLLAQQFRLERCPAFRPDTYWLNAVGTAFSTGRLGRTLTPPLEADAAYLSGLLHNMGLLLLTHVFPAEMNRILAEHRPGTGTSLGARIREAIDVDHHEAGAMLLGEWGLPDAVVATARQVGTEHPHGPWSRLIQAVTYCAEWTALAFEDAPQSPPPPGADAATLTRVGGACREEWKHLEAVAALLAGG